MESKEKIISQAILDYREQLWKQLRDTMMWRVTDIKEHMMLAEIAVLRKYERG